MSEEFEPGVLFQEERYGKYRVTGWRDVKFLGKFECKEYEVRDHDTYRVVICPNFAYIEGEKSGDKILLFKNERLARRLPKRIIEMLEYAGFQV